MSGYKPNIINWSFGFYTTHSVGFFIKKKSQLKVGLYDLKYNYSADYDLFLRMIKRFKLRGLSTKKEEIKIEVRKTEGSKCPRCWKILQKKCIRCEEATLSN